MNAADALTDRFGTGADVIRARAPGRVNLLGEHTDYNDGYVLPTIVGAHVEVAVRRRPDRTVRMLAADYDQTISFELADPPHLADPPQPDWPDWAPYLYGVTEELRLGGHVDGGFDLAVRGTLPRGSGLSSSAALETAAALALERGFRFELEPLAMTRLCRDVEHRWVGVRCGIMDQVACRLGRPGQALLIDCRDQQYRHVPFDLDGHVLVITDSGVRRRLGDSAYNERRRECERGVALFRQRDPAIRSLRDVDATALDAHARSLPQPVADRCRHVIEENARVLAGESALVEGDADAFGRLMVAAHASLRDLYEASHPAVDRLVDAALQIEGVVGSRLTGAGWGGCTVTLCAEAAVDRLRSRMQQELERLGTTGSVMLVGEANAAGIVETTE